MKFLLGTKVNMTQVFDENGVVHPATVLKTGPMVVTQVKTVDTDGYNAVQVGFGTRAAKNINKALKGHMKEGNYAHLVEFRVEDTSAFKVGETVPASFVTGDVVTTTSVSKGKGFQGGVKRHGFKGGPRSHGQKHSEREPGSLGGGGRDGGSVSKGKGFQGGVKRHGFKGGPRSHGQKHSEREPGSLGGGGRDGGRVAKGKRMAGRMGSDVITSKGLTIVGVNTDANEIYIRGAVAGKRGTLVEILG